MSNSGVHATRDRGGAKGWVQREGAVHAGVAPDRGLAPGRPLLLPPRDAVFEGGASGRPSTVEAGRLALRGVFPKIGRLGESLEARP